jgi:hypothetical protein
LAASSLLVDGQEGLDELLRALGLDQRVKRMRRPEGVPQREDRVVPPALGAVDAAVVAAVAAVDVRPQVGSDQRVVERGVEDLSMGRRAALDLDAAQGGVPDVAGDGAERVEVAVALLGVEVLPRPLDVDSRDADADQQLAAAVAEVQAGLDVLALELAHPGLDDVV